ncbi:MAG TPA: hypothetical protein VGI79_23185 [Caulobacteraceae bacterium]|jgi:hypothetical protein
MKLNLSTSAVAVATAMFLVVPLSAHADLPGKHPGYLHALTDLRSARWLISHRPGDTVVSAHEDAAVQKIVAAISDIQRDAVNDGKGLEDHPAADAPAFKADRLTRALELLNAAHKDVNAEEDNPKAAELKKVALNNIDEAAKQLKAALWDLSHAK